MIPVKPRVCTTLGRDVRSRQGGSAQAPKLFKDKLFAVPSTDVIGDTGKEITHGVKAPFMLFMKVGKHSSRGDLIFLKSCISHVNSLILKNLLMFLI